MKGLKFGIPPKKANETDILTAFELSYRNLKDLPINESTYMKDRFKNKFADIAYSYSRKYTSKTENNLTPEEWKGLISCNSCYES